MHRTPGSSTRRSPSRLRLECLEPREVPAGVPLLAFGADAGVEPRVRVVERETGTVRFDFLAFATQFRGGVRVAVGDVTGDGQDDVIAATGPGSLPVVKVFDGATGDLVKRFSPDAPGPGRAAGFRSLSFHSVRPSFREQLGGVTVAADDVNGDGKAEVIVGFAGAPGLIGVFNGTTGRQRGGFLVTGTQGVRVAAGDLDGDGKAEIIAGSATGPLVRVFDGETRRRELDVRPFGAGHRGGMYVAAADTDGDGRAEIIAGSATGPEVAILDGRTGADVARFNSEVTGGTRVAGAHISTDGRADVLTSSATNGNWAAYDSDGQKLAEAEIAGFNTGVWVAASPEQAAINHHASQVVLDWNSAALDAIRVERTAPPIASRAMAILQTAVYDAVNGIIRGFEQYLVRGRAPAGASVQAAAAQAAYTTLVALFPNQKPAFDALLASSLDRFGDGRPETDGIAWGRTVAEAILAFRANDGSGANPPYTPATEPGDWQPTLPAFAPALLPGWGDVRPFGVDRVANFLPGGPADLSSQEWADEFNEVKQLGSKTSTVRTDDQTAIALFWADGAGTFTPSGHWNAIAGQLAHEDGLSLLTTARLFAQLDIAEADAAIVCWEAKYTYNFWRPVTAIRVADTDGNDLTEKDAAWEPLIVTPPFPDHTSGHSTFSGAASAILAAYFGADRAFSTTSDNGTLTRSFTSFAQAADEAGVSRIYGGIHYRSANDDGLACGREIAAHVLNNVLES
jgi:membrane-associated phospholipid phosphatase